MPFVNSLNKLAGFVPALVAGAALALVLPISAAHAAPYTFAPFNVNANSTVNSVPLSGAPTGTVYTQFSVSLNWGGSTGSAWSSEAIWALTNAAAPITSSTVFYADPGPATNSADSTAARTLTWSGFLDTPYIGGNPLNFMYLQSFTGSGATWSNISVTLDTNAPTPPPSTSFTQPTTIGSSLALNNSLSAGGVNWYSFTYLGGDLSFDTLGSTITGSDTELALYNALGGVVVENDDINTATGNYLSRINVSQSSLTLGNTYYIAAAGYNASFAGGFTATTTSTATGNLRVNVTVVPEGSTAGLLGLGGFMSAVIAVVARRRKAA